MSKIQMGPQTWVYPMPAFLVGANVDGTPNIMAVAWAGICNGKPPMISVALQHHRHTNKGIRQNQTFSVNIPSADLVKETDYCGIASGSKVNKLEVCRFNVFYGKLESAPLIEQCPVNMECKVIHILDLGSHDLIIGRIEETHVTEDCLIDGKPDVSKIKPLVFSIGHMLQYHPLGDVIARAFSIGRELEDRE